MYIPINERAHKFAEIKRIFSQYFTQNIKVNI